MEKGLVCAQEQRIILVQSKLGCCGSGNSTSIELSDRRPWQGTADFVLFRE